MKLNCFGAKCIFGRYDKNSKIPKVFEERVILVKANDENTAIKFAEAEAKKFAVDVSDPDTMVKYEGFVDVYTMSLLRVKSGSEIYSLTRQNRKNGQQKGS